MTSLLYSLVLLALPLCLALFDDKSGVIQLDASNFDQRVIKNERAVMVKFYAPYCGYCKKMVPAYNKLAENMKEIVDIASIDCTSSVNQAICAKYRVEGYPTLKFFIIREDSKDKGKKKKIVLDYNSDRSTVEMTKFIKHHMHKFIFSVSNANANAKVGASKWAVKTDEFFAKGGSMPKLLLFRTSTGEAPTILFRALSIKYHYKIVVGEVSTSADKDFSSKFSLPTGKVGLVFFPSGQDDEKSVIFNGKTTRTDIFAFLDKQLAIQSSEKVDL